jgi:hypothetical protein
MSAYETPGAPPPMEDDNMKEDNEILCIEEPQPKQASSKIELSSFFHMQK